MRQKARGAGLRRVHQMIQEFRRRQEKFFLPSRFVLDSTIQQPTKGIKMFSTENSRVTNKKVQEVCDQELVCFHLIAFN